MKSLPKLVMGIVASLAIFGFAGVAFAAPYDFEIQHRDGTDTSDVPQNITPPTLLNNTSYLPYFDDTLEQYSFIGIGSGIHLAGGFLSVTPSSIETPEGHLTDTLAGLVSTSTFNGLSSTVSTLGTTVSGLSATVAGLGTPFSISGFMGSNGSTTPYVASTTQNGFMSAAMVSKLNAISTSTRAFSSPSRAVNTAYQPSATRDTEVHASVDITTTLSLSGGTTGKVTLQYADDSGFTTNVVSVQQYTNSNTGTLALGLNISQIGTADLNGIVPAGKYYRLLTTNVTGTATYGTPTVSEVLLPT